MNIRRKIWALLLSAALVLTLMPAAVFAEGEDAGIIRPVSARDYGILFSEPGNTDIANLYTTGSGFAVTYSDGSEIYFDYRRLEIASEDGEETRVIQGFYPADSPDMNEEECLDAEYYNQSGFRFGQGWNEVTLDLYVPYIDSATGEMHRGTDMMPLDVRVWCGKEKASRVEFIPAEGFVPECHIGTNLIDEAVFFGEGNAFAVTYESLSWDTETSSYTTIGYTATYQYMPEDPATGRSEGFYDLYEDFETGETVYEYFEFGGYNTYRLSKGMNNVTLTYYEFRDDETIEVDFDVTIAAKRYTAYGNWYIFDYTGKAISSKSFAKYYVMRDTDGRVIPASAYTVSRKSAKKQGWYTATIKFKNPDKYGDPVVVDYGIGPKAPKIKSVKGGKKSLTIRWNKFTKSQLKNIDGMYLLIAEDKEFNKIVKTVKLSKSAIKKNKKVIKKLKGRRRYYVQAYTFNKIKQSGETFNMNSRDSNIKNGKTK